ncbi:MAG: hypothetical protein IPI53_11955 [Saprospiraceae bacterium]|nr:hypothetical protein [Saprospiraceae bacterium]
MISNSGTGTVNIQNNIIGSITTPAQQHQLDKYIGIIISGTAASVTITGNTIGNATANNMRGGTVGLTTGSSLVTGINLPSTPTTATITNNIIQKLIKEHWYCGVCKNPKFQRSKCNSNRLVIPNNTINNLSTNVLLLEYR